MKEVSQCNAKSAEMCGHFCKNEVRVIGLLGEQGARPAWLDIGTSYHVAKNSQCGMCKVTSQWQARENDAKRGVEL